MSRFRKLSQMLRYCQYYSVWVPKYRYRILKGRVGQDVEHCVGAFCQRQCPEIVELNIQSDHVHALVMIPPKVSVPDFVGVVKGRMVIGVLNKHQLKNEPYWGNHFWAQGYCVDTVGLDAEMIRKYVKYQEAKERRTEQLGLF